MGKKKKRGISPLIATVLILGFTVALAAIIMMWGSGFTRDVSESTEGSAKASIVCGQDVMFEIKDVCKSFDGLYKVTVSNDGKEGIDKFNVRLYSGSEVESKALSSVAGQNVVDAFGIQTLKVAVDPSWSVSNILDKVELIPTIEVDGSQVTCGSNVVSKSVSLKDCYAGTEPYGDVWMLDNPCVLDEDSYCPSSLVWGSKNIDVSYDSVAILASIDGAPDILVNCYPANEVPPTSMWSLDEVVVTPSVADVKLYAADMATNCLDQNFDTLGELLAEDTVYFIS